MWFGVILSWSVVENIWFWYFIEWLFVHHEGTDDLPEVAGLDTNIPQEGVASPLSHDNYFSLTKGSGFLNLCLKIPASFCQRRVYLTSGIWLSFERWLLFFGALPRPCSLVCHVLFLGMSPVWWWFLPRCTPVRGLCQTAIVSLWHFDTVFLCAECWEYFIGLMEDPTFMWKFTAFSIKSYIHFLKDACDFVLPFSNSLVLTGLYVK